MSFHCISKRSSNGRTAWDRSFHALPGALGFFLMILVIASEIGTSSRGFPSPDFASDEFRGFSVLEQVTPYQSDAVFVHHQDEDKAVLLTWLGCPGFGRNLYAHSSDAVGIQTVKTCKPQSPTGTFQAMKLQGVNRYNPRSARH